MERLIELRYDTQYCTFNPPRMRRKHHSNWHLKDDSLRSSALVRPASKGRNKISDLTLKLPTARNMANATIEHIGSPGSLTVPPSPTVLIIPNSASTGAPSPGAAPAPASPVAPDTIATTSDPSLPSDAKSARLDINTGTEENQKKTAATASATNTTITTSSGVKMSSAAALSPASAAHTSSISPITTSNASASLIAPAKAQYRRSASKSALQAKKLALQIKELQIQQQDLLKAAGGASASGSVPPSPITPYTATSMPHTPNTPVGPPPASPLPPVPHSKSHFAQEQQDATARNRDKPLPSTDDINANAKTMSEEEEDEDILPLVNVRERDRERDRDSASSHRRRVNGSSSRQQTQPYSQPLATGTSNSNHHHLSDPSSSSPDRKTSNKYTSKSRSVHSNNTARALNDSHLLSAPLTTNGSQLGHSAESLFASPNRRASANRRRSYSNPSTKTTTTGGGSAGGANRRRRGNDAGLGGSSIGSNSEEEDSDERDNKSDVDLLDRERGLSMDLERDSLNLPASIAHARVFDTRIVQAISATAAPATTTKRPMTAFTASANGHSVGAGIRGDLFVPGGRNSSLNTSRPGGGGSGGALSPPWSGWTVSELRNSAATDMSGEEIIAMPANLPDWSEVERGGPTSLPIHQIQRDLDFSMRRLINIQVFEECAFFIPFF